MTVDRNAGDAPLPVDDVMADVRARVRARLRDRLRSSGQDDFADRELFEEVERVLRRAAEIGPSGLILPDLLDDPDQWRIDTALRWGSHRPLVGRLLVAIKRSILLPLFRWLFEYSRDNFTRQQRLNDVLLACVQALAVEHVRLRREVERLRAQSPGGAASGSLPPGS